MVKDASRLWQGRLVLFCVGSLLAMVLILDMLRAVKHRIVRAGVHTARKRG